MLTFLRGMPGCLLSGNETIFAGSNAMPKILVIRFSSIGDLVLTTPVIRCLHRQLGAEVHVVTKKSFARLLEANPNVARVHVPGDRWGDLIGSLREERFDAVVDLHKNLLSFRLRMALGVKSYSFDKLNAAKWLLTALHIDRLPRKHLVDRYFEGISSLGVIYDGQGADHFIPPGEELDPARWIGTAGPYLVGVLGAAHATKRIPREKWEEMLGRMRLPLLLVGGPAEGEEGEILATRQWPVPVYNTAGTLSLHQSASLIRQAAAVITPDTGMMHIAAALRKPVIAVWGNTVPAFGMYPFLAEGAPDAVSMEVDDLACRPCSKLGSPRCPRGHFRCMMDQDGRAIVQAAEDAAGR